MLLPFGAIIHLEGQEDILPCLCIRRYIFDVLPQARVIEHCSRSKLRHIHTYMLDLLICKLARLNFILLHQGFD